MIRSTRLITHSTRSTRLFTRTTRLSTHSNRHSTRSNCLSTRNTHSTICRSFIIDQNGSRNICNRIFMFIDLFVTKKVICRFKLNKYIFFIKSSTF